MEESPPSVKIHIPSTPVIENAVSLPAVKVPVKAPRVIKSGGPPLKSSLVTLNPPTKLKLPAGPPPEAVSVKISPPVPPVPSVVEAPKKAVAFTKTEIPPKVSKTKPPKVPAPKVANKPAHVPKAQSGGMSLNDLRASRNALKKLKANKHAVIFLQPVDPIRDHAPKSGFVFTHHGVILLRTFYSYFDIIKDPMDLSTMGAKLEEGMYKDRFAFQADLKLMVENAKHYNLAGSYVHNEAIALETFFEKRRSQLLFCFVFYV